ncbi:MAG: HAD hydrolase-like protein [Candidatus Eisenbacteria bacterium]
MKRQQGLVVLFDLDGTLSDPGKGIFESVCYALKELGRPCPSFEALRQQVGAPLETVFQNIMDGASAADVKRASEIYKTHFDTYGYRESRVYDGVEETLKTLRQAGCALFVATAKKADIAWKTVSYLGLAGYFKDVFGGDGKSPKARMVGEIVESLGAALDETFLVGDRWFDVTAAREVGIHSVGVTWGYGSLSELREAGVATLVDTPEELCRIVLRYKGTSGDA